jgi:glutamate 5-kinase
MKHKGRTPKKIVVKVGTSSLVASDGSIDVLKLGNLVDQLASIKENEIDVVLVSSGAIRVGMKKLGMKDRPKTIPEQQASAAVGQGLLMQMYNDLFSKHNITTAQVLLTREDFDHRTRYLNGRNTLYALLNMNCVPIVNENDTVATDEIKFGENDTLSALVAACVDADLLINLSDVDGLYDSDPRSNNNCKLIEEVAEITSEIEELAGGTDGLCGSGGMKSKIDAAKIAVNSGVRMVIARASLDNVITKIVAGNNIGTRFLSHKIELNHRKRWIAFANINKGNIIVNEGAAGMVREKGKSLLAAGIISCDGDFEVGDLVAILDENKNQIACGLANYCFADVCRIKGKKSTEIEQILGYKDYDEVVHRDNLVIV